MKLAVGTNEFQLPIGMQLRRDNQGKWQMAEPSYSSSDRSDRSESTRFARAVPPPASAERPPPLPGPPGPPEEPGNGEPQVVVDPSGQPLALDAPAEPGDTNAPPEAASGSGETDPVLLRLMQRRAQEANR